MVDLIAQLRRAGKDLFNGENWAAIPQRKAKLWKFENIRTLAVADTREEVMRYVWNSYWWRAMFWFSHAKVFWRRNLVCCCLAGSWGGASYHKFSTYDGMEA